MSKHKIVVALQAGGASLISAAAGLTSPRLGLLVAGVAALMFGIAIEREPATPLPQPEHDLGGDN